MFPAIIPDIQPNAHAGVDMAKAPNVYLGARYPLYAIDIPNISSVIQAEVTIRLKSDVPGRNFCVRAVLISR